MSTNNQLSKDDIRMLDNIVIVSLAGTRIYSGRSKLTRKDLGAEVADKLPPDTLISLGVARTCDSKELAKFASSRSAAEQACLAVGTRLLGGFAMTPESAKEVLPKLKIIKDGFYSLKPDFLKNYESNITKWGDQPQHQDWRHLVDDHCHSVEYVEENLQFGFSVFRVSPVGDETFDLNLIEQAKGMTNQILNEVSTSANSFYKKLTEKAAEEMTAKGLNPLRQIRSKLSALKLIDPKIIPIIELIDAFFNKLPSDNSIAGNDFMAVCWIVRMLSSVKEIKAYGSTLLEGKTTASSFVNMYYPKDEVVQPEVIQPEVVVSTAVVQEETERSSSDEFVQDAPDALETEFSSVHPSDLFDDEPVVVLNDVDTGIDLSSLIVFDTAEPDVAIA
ncbi:MAG: DUF3150 domain-containing protein [Methylophilus sp.]|uniref:DUF3150 domain-containing protein n=1 Tax=Methylophilus sp. TaxID=29541 RepID=UPI003F9F8981